MKQCTGCSVSILTRGVWCPALPVFGVERAAQPGAMGAPSYVQPDRWDQAARQQPNACGPTALLKSASSHFPPDPKIFEPADTIGGEMKAAGTPPHRIILQCKRENQQFIARNLSKLYRRTRSTART